jgi:hypothetical protein
MLLVPAWVLIAHARLWPQGPWFDEYYGFAAWRLWGFAGEWARLVHWAPRPFSEALLYFYWRAVQAAGAPVVSLALGCAWAILFIFHVAAAKPWRSPGRIARAALVLSLPALFLLSGPVEEMYFWPYGALAYVPALGAACFAVIRVAGPGLGARHGWVGLAVALAIGATSAEHGTFLAAGMAPILVAVAVRGPRDGRLVRLASTGLLMAVVAGVLVMFWNGRIAHAGETFGDPAVAHRVWRDVGLALGQLGREFLRPDGWSLGASVLVKGMVFVGGRYCLAAAWPVAPPRLPLVALLVGLAAVPFLSILGAYYNFGTLCCQQMASYRQAIFLLFVVAVAAVWRPVRLLEIGAPLLALAALINLHPRLVAVAAEYRLAGARAASRNTTYGTGMAPGGGTLEFVVPPRGPLFDYRVFRPGVYELSPQTPGPAQFPLMYFDKHRMWAHDYTSSR